MACSNLRAGLVATLALTLAFQLGNAAELGQDAGAPETWTEHEAAQYVKDRGGPPAHTRTSRHFALHWGDVPPKDKVIDDAFADQALSWLETLWTNYIDIQHFQKPRHHFKLNAYITGTGLKPFLDGFAYGFGDPEGHGTLIGHWTIFKSGDNGAAHEFVHALQAESGGFRDSRFVGSFWETHAQFLSHQVTGVGDLPHVLDRYAQTAQWDVASTRHHYGSWIFYQYIAEHVPDGMSLVNRLWTEPRADPDEDAIAKLRRLLPLTGDRERAWADLIGDYAKRNVSWSSYRLGSEYRRSLSFFSHPERRNYFTWLATSPSRPGWWRVPRFYAPQQNGYNIIPLRVDDGASSITVEFMGFDDPVLRSAWRVTEVSVDSDYHEHFSATWSSGSQTIAVRPGEQHFLVVAAAPGQHHPPPFKDLFQGIPYHPYEIQCRGAIPRSLDIRVRPLPSGVAGIAHGNGGGFVAASAVVDADAYVGKHAAVLGRAHVTGKARIEDFATIDDDALVADQAAVRGNAWVGGHARVEGEAMVGDFAEISDSALIHDRAQVMGSSRVVNQTSVSESAVVKGYTSTTSIKRVRGGAILDGDVEWDFAADELSTGIYFGSLLQSDDAQKQPDSRMLYAHWPMQEPHAWKIADVFGSNDGVEQGGAQVVSDKERGHALQLSGNGQFADAPGDVVCHRELTIASWVWIDRNLTNQGLFASPGGEGHPDFEVLACNEQGLIALHLGAGATAITVNGPAAPLRTWFQVACTVGDGGISLYVDGKLVGHYDVPQHLDGSRPRSFFLGRRVANGFLTGRVSDLAIWMRALSAADISAIHHVP
jgi:carbonic anhydrase/acetyltransferase-like protein (isoleucine patch superfamily)